jgi:hypothetical protein
MMYIRSSNFQHMCFTLSVSNYKIVLPFSKYIVFTIYLDIVYI